MRITADTARCVGAGQCVLSAPAVFDQDDQAIVTLLADSAEDPGPVRQAVDRCPSGAITVEEGTIP